MRQGRLLPARVGFLPCALAETLIVGSCSVALVVTDAVFQDQLVGSSIFDWGLAQALMPPWHQVSSEEGPDWFRDTT